MEEDKWAGGREKEMREREERVAVGTVGTGKGLFATESK
jgi:hypothetical protein